MSIHHRLVSLKPARFRLLPVTGDIGDLVNRLRSALPKRWFSETSPNLNAVLTCIATPWSWIYGLISYGILQTRLGTATDAWLDLIAFDYFGDLLARRPGEADASFRVRIIAALLTPAATREAISSGLTAITGSAPQIFEPANCMDTGAYCLMSPISGLTACGLAYGQAGGWGSLALPFQTFITTKRPPTPGVGYLSGYGLPYAGYGEGVICYADQTLWQGQVTDQDIRVTLSNLLPVNATAWLRII